MCWYVVHLQVRDWIVPVNRRHKLPQLIDLLRRHYPAGNSLGRRVLVEYTMLAGVNDTLEDAARLVKLLEGVEAKVSAQAERLALLAAAALSDNKSPHAAVAEVLSLGSLQAPLGLLCCRSILRKRLLPFCVVLVLAGELDLLQPVCWHALQSISHRASAAVPQCPDSGWPCVHDQRQ